MHLLDPPSFHPSLFCAEYPGSPQQTERCIKTTLKRVTICLDISHYQPGSSGSGSLPGAILLTGDHFSGLETGSDKVKVLSLRAKVITLRVKVASL